MRTIDAIVTAAFGALLIGIVPPPGGRGRAGRDAVNDVLGDASFVDAFGRLPGPGDGDAVRIRTHLAYVERLLRAVDVSGWDEGARRRRLENLDRLHAYAAAGIFPRGDSADRRLPTFIDDDGRRCAVAALVEASAGAERARAIARRFRNAYIPAIDDPAFDAWIAGSGLSRAELAMIQPTYNFSVDTPSLQVDWRLNAQGLHALTTSAGNPARDIAAADGGLRLVFLPDAFMTGKWTVGVDGAAGASFSGDPYYRLVARGGMVFAPFFPGDVMGIDVGLGGERLGDAVPSAIIAPLEIYWYVEPGRYDPYAVKRARVQLRAESQLVRAGHDQDFEWAAYLDLSWLSLRSWGAWQRPGLTLSGGVRELGGVHYAVLAVGFSARHIFTKSVSAADRSRAGGEPPW